MPLNVPAVSTTQDVLLNAIIVRLIATVSTPLVLSADSCFLSMYEPVAFIPPSDIWVQVRPASGQFDLPAIAASGQAQVPEASQVEIKLCSRLMLDQVGQSPYILSQATENLCLLKGAVLAALTEFSFPNESGEPQVEMYLKPLSSGMPHQQADGESDVAVWPLIFELDFQWALGGFGGG